MSDTSNIETEDAAPAATSNDTVDTAALMADARSEAEADANADVISVKITTPEVSAASDSKQEQELTSVKDSESEKGLRLPQRSQVPVVSTSACVDLNAQTSLAKVTSTHDLVFETKKKKRKVDSDPNSHSVTFTVNIAMAVPTGKI